MATELELEVAREALTEALAYDSIGPEFMREEVAILIRLALRCLGD